ncbi:MAG: hypothetical protein FJ221_09200 [Lentisphaerae bacterium]|nr:hypothetical protein [Lentisphaerota bacterium]
MAVQHAGIASGGFRVRDPFTLTIFGATGDLTHRKLMPALFSLFRQGLLPDQFAVVGFARRDYTDESFRAWMGESIGGSSPTRPPSPGSSRPSCRTSTTTSATSRPTRAPSPGSRAVSTPTRACRATTSSTCP